MTEQTSTTTNVPQQLVPAGVDMLDGLTVRELSIASTQIKCDVVQAIGNDKDGKRWEAFPRIAWLWAKRQDPQAKLEPFLNMTMTELLELLGMDDDEDEDPAAAIEENPTVPAPE